MQISRMCKHYTEWCAAGVLAETWKNWGFLDAYTGGEIQPNATYTGTAYVRSSGVFVNNESNWGYKWKYDNYDSCNYFYFCNRKTSNNFNDRWNCLYFNLSAQTNFLTDSPSDRLYTNINTPMIRNRMDRGGSAPDTTIRKSDYINMFFIPLKNNGFIFKQEASTPINTSLNNFIAMYGFPLQLTTYYKQINPFLWDLFSYRRVASTTSGTGRISNSTVIGFFNNITNKMNYILLTIHDGSPYRSTSGGGWQNRLNTIYTYWDNKDSAILDFIPYLDETGEYTDVKENICTLIKYPYETGALSNLYIISTSPQRRKCSFVDEDGNDGNGLDGKFFSFNGRNFYGLYNNLAVELPSN